MQSSLVGGYQHFRGTYCLHLQFYHKDGSSEMSATSYKITKHHNPEDYNPQLHCHENFKSHAVALTIINLLLLNINITECEKFTFASHNRLLDKNQNFKKI
jgi:hypothetical protein